MWSRLRIYICSVFPLVVHFFAIIISFSPFQVSILLSGKLYFFVSFKQLCLCVYKFIVVTLLKPILQIIARTVYKTLISMDNWKRCLMLNFLHHTRGTLVGEILQKQNQHIVNLSHLFKSEVVMISMTPTFTGQQVDSLLALPPHHLLNLCKALGLHTAAYTVIPRTQVMDRKAKVSVLPLILLFFAERERETSILINSWMVCYPYIIVMTLSTLDILPLDPTRTPVLKLCDGKVTL